MERTLAICISLWGVVLTSTTASEAPIYEVSSPFKFLLSDVQVRMVMNNKDSSQIYITDPKMNAVLVLSTSTAGSTPQIFAGNLSNPTLWMDGHQLSATFYQPRGICQDHEGNVFVADSGNAVIRRIDSKTGLTFVGPNEIGEVSTVAGQPRKPGVKDGPGEQAQFTNGISAIICDSGTFLQNESLIERKCA
eukprot:gene24255-9855_t